MNNLVILGATGSIGKSTLAVIDLHPNNFNIIGLSANKNHQAMLKLCTKYQPKWAVMTSPSAAKKLAQGLKNTTTTVLSGAQPLSELVSKSEVDIVMAAIVGSAGMMPTLSAIKAHKKVLLANKESLVLAGDLMTQALANSKATLIPIDSEHSAVFQCLQADRNGVKKIQLTASGGPFLHTPIKKLASITPEQACNHPNWSMGRKISVDSATMMNKGLEAIEAHYLFGLDPAQIEVIIHPQSVVHSLVHYEDGAALAQLSIPDMQTAIAYGLSYPKRLNSGVAELDLSSYGRLDFYSPDLEKFTCLNLGLNALKIGSSAIGVLNAANEVAVDAFLNGKISFLQIANTIEKTLNAHSPTKLNSLEEVLANDKKARIDTQMIINKAS